LSKEKINWSILNAFANCVPFERITQAISDEKPGVKEKLEEFQRDFLEKGKNCSFFDFPRKTSQRLTLILNRKTL